MLFYVLNFIFNCWWTNYFSKLNIRCHLLSEILPALSPNSLWTSEDISDQMFLKPYLLFMRSCISMLSASSVLHSTFFHCRQPLFFFVKICLLILQREEGREKGIDVREKHWPAGESNLQPFRCMGWCSNPLSHPAGAAPLSHRHKRNPCNKRSLSISSFALRNISLSFVYLPFHKLLITRSA